MKTQNYKKGKEGEEEALKYLENKNYVLVEKNFQNDLGEIDLIMTDNEWLVFVEVKYKHDDILGLPEEMIGKNKLAQVRRVAESYLVQRKEVVKNFEKYRIDGVCILAQEIRHYVNLE